MPIEYCIDHPRRLVVARALGVLTDADVFGYQREIASQPDVTGYDELIDMTEVQEIVLPSACRVWDLAVESAAGDPIPGGARFAIVAPEKLAFGLGRMYQTYRDADPRSTKKVGVFRTLEEALAFLDVSGLEPGISA